jgi:hypothetical protein
VAAGAGEPVQRIVDGGDWPFLSPFTRVFRDRFGHRPADARRWWQENGRPPIGRALLAVPSGLTAALPLFCEADPSVRPIARNTRIAHNHWVLGEIAEQRSGPDRKAITLDIIGGWLAGPSTVTTRRLGAARKVLLRPTP